MAPGSATSYVFSFRRLEILVVGRWLDWMVRVLPTFEGILLLIFSVVGFGGGGGGISNCKALEVSGESLCISLVALTTARLGVAALTATTSGLGVPALTTLSSIGVPVFTVVTIFLAT